MKWANSIGRFYLYSNLHIGLCALFFCLEYSGFGNQKVDYSYFFFIGTSTVALYLLHRSIGLAKVKAAQSIDSRYLAINKVIPYYPYLGILFGGLSTYFLFQTGLQILPTLLVPLILSVLYVIPFLPNGRRLRDISLIKIFVIALTWTWFSMWYLVGKIEGTLLGLITVEHFLFILGITLPFDMRDMSIDRNDGVLTLATLLGKAKSLRLTNILLILSCSLTLVIVFFYSQSTLPLVFYSILYLALLWFLNVHISFKRDFYFTGVLDGIILLKGAIGWLFVI